MLRRLVDRLYASPVMLLTLTTTFWAGNAVAGQLARGEVQPVVLVFLRWVMVASLLWIVFGPQVLRHWDQVRPKFWRIVFMAALGYTGFNTLFYIASLYTTAVNVGILQGSMPMFVMAGAFLTHGTRVGFLQLAGVLATALGVIVVATRGAPLEIFEIGLNGGDALMLLACAIYAGYTVMLRDRPQMPGAAFFTLMAAIAAVASLPMLAIEAYRGTAMLPTANGWMITLFVAIFPSCLAQLFFMRGVDLIGPNRAGVFINLVPVFSAILAVVIVSEPFMLYHAASLVLVLGGIGLAQQSAPRPLAQRKPAE